MKFVAGMACMFLILGCSKPHAGTPMVEAQPHPEPTSQNTISWNLFVPEESRSASCRFIFDKTETHSGNQSIQLTSLHLARFGIYADHLGPIEVKPGQRYRLTAWIKAGRNFAIEAGTPGLVLRATLFDRHLKDVPGGHVFVGLAGMRRGDATLLSSEPVPSVWTKVEGVIEIPAGTVHMILFVFCWKASGTIWLDDVSVTELGAS